MDAIGFLQTGRAAFRGGVRGSPAVPDGGAPQDSGPVHRHGDTLSPGPSGVASETVASEASAGGVFGVRR